MYTKKSDLSNLTMNQSTLTVSCAPPFSAVNTPSRNGEEEERKKQRKKRSEGEKEREVENGVGGFSREKRVS